MASLIDLVSSRMTPEVVQKLAGLAGISATDTKRALEAIVPAQFDGLASMGATEAGAGRLLALLQKHKGTESFAQVLVAGEAMESQAKMGDTLQTAIYGSKLSQHIGSMASSEVFLQQLQHSGPIRFKDGKLIINLKTDAGTMEFVPAR
jgi:hypothetical protein